MKAHRAIIPAAGLGTRMQPFSLVVPKELVPLGSRPALDFVVREADEAGISEIVLVLSPRKDLIRDYLDRMGEREPYSRLRFTFVIQDEASGLADAIDLCREPCDDESFALLLPDNLFLSSRYRLAAMTELAAEDDRDVIGVIELDHRHSGLYGNCGRIEYSEIAPSVLEISELHSKGAGRLLIPPGETLRRACGRYVFQPTIFEAIESVRSGVQGECSEVPAVQRIIAERGALGCLLPQPLFDVGTPEGVLAASAALLETAPDRE